MKTVEQVESVGKWEHYELWNSVSNVSMKQCEHEEQWEHYELWNSVSSANHVSSGVNGSNVSSWSSGNSANSGNSKISGNNGGTGTAVEVFKEMIQSWAIEDLALQTMYK